MQGPLNKSLQNRNHNQAAPGIVPSGRGKGDRPKGNERAAAKPRSATPNRTPQGGDRGQPKGTPRGRATNAGGKGSDDVPGKGTCWAFQKGACTRGVACAFSHVKERGQPAKPRYGSKGKKQCPFFALGTCRFGDGCENLHGGDRPRDASPKAKPKGKRKGDREASSRRCCDSITKSSCSSGTCDYGATWVIHGLAHYPVLGIFTFDGSWLCRSPSFQLPRPRDRVPILANGYRV